MSMEVDTTMSARGQPDGDRHRRQRWYRQGVRARRLLERGYDVVLTARREGPLAETAKKLGCRHVAADCAEPADFARVVAACERVDLLVHAAGTLKGTFVRKERIEDFDEVIRANLRSTFVAAPGSSAGDADRRSHHPYLVIRRGRRHEGTRRRTRRRRGRSTHSPKRLREEVFRDGIHVNVVMPAPVETDMLDTVTFEMYVIQIERCC